MAGCLTVESDGRFGHTVIINDDRFKTAEGIGVGSEASAVRAAYPKGKLNDFAELEQSYEFTYTVGDITFKEAIKHLTPEVKFGDAPISSVWLEL